MLFYRGGIWNSESPVEVQRLFRQATLKLHNGLSQNQRTYVGARSEEDSGDSDIAQ